MVLRPLYRFQTKEFEVIKTSYSSNYQGKKAKMLGKYYKMPKKQNR